MIFEWDDTKSEINLKERGFGFRFAAEIFNRPTLLREDSRADYGEPRWIATGEHRGMVLTVVYTDRSDVRRIISARRADRKERAQWQSFAERYSR